MIAALLCTLSGARGFTGIPVEKFPEAHLHHHLRAAANVHAIERAVSRNGYCVVAVRRAASCRFVGYQGQKALPQAVPVR
jgi:hypothetical protein